jgi:hypothetical protein
MENRSTSHLVAMGISGYRLTGACANQSGHTQPTVTAGPGLGGSSG